MSQIQSNIDPAIIQSASGRLLEGAAAAYQRREHVVDAMSGQLVSGMTAFLEGTRELFSNIRALVLNRIISDQTGEDDMLSERILNARSAQFQPQEATYSDPNYRAGASAPPGTAAQGKGSGVTVTGTTATTA